MFAVLVPSSGSADIMIIFEKQRVFVVLCCVVLHCVVLCCIVLYCIVFYNFLSCCIVFIFC